MTSDACEQRYPSVSLSSPLISYLFSSPAVLPACRSLTAAEPLPLRVCAPSSHHTETSGVRREGEREGGKSRKRRNEKKSKQRNMLYLKPISLLFEQCLPWMNVTLKSCFGSGRQRVKRRKRARQLEQRADKRATATRTWKCPNKAIVRASSNNCCAAGKRLNVYRPIRPGTRCTCVHV